MAHLARVLAAEGRKVLLVETGHSDRGFRAHLGLAGQTADRRWDQALRGSVTPVRVAGRADEGRIDLLELRDGPQDRPGALRAHLSAAGYDHVLVDSPSGDSPGARACTLVLPDIVAVCFTRGPWEPGESVDVVQDILRRAPGHVRVVPAVMMADPAAGPQPDLRSRLAPPLDGRVLPDVEVPYQARRRSGPAPVSAVARFRLDAYERLAVVITGDAAVRARSVAPARLLVVRSWRDRLWAEWIRGQLLSAGREARDVALTDFAADVPPDVHVLVVVSASTHGPAEELLRLIEARRAAAAPKEDLGMSVVYVESVELPAGLTGLPEIDISTAETDFAAYEPLRRRLSLNRVAPSPSGARFPGRPVVRWLPARNPGFVGRDPILESLRDLLLERRHVVVGGATGLGKSQLALELAHRYAGAYDVVAWLPAENAQVLRAALGALAVHAEVPTGRDAVVALLAQVNSGDKRWLLIYDNADVPAELDGLLPGARDTCHVVITSQSDGWGALPRVETTVFDEAESVELVTDRVPAVTADDARRVARLTARIPLVVELSAAWIAAEAARQGGRNLLDRTAAERAVTAFIARFSELSAELASRVATVEHAAVVALATEAVRDHGGGAAAVWLLRACSLLSADGISLRLLHTSPITACLRAVDERLGDSFMIDPILRAITTYRLAQVGFEERSVFVMHRLVQQMVRSAMTIEELAVLRAELQRALAACTPTDMEVDHGWHRTVFAELADHLVPSGALESEEPSVRDWVVNQLRYFWQQGDKSAWERARDLGERAERLWRATPGVEP
ncbi:MAG TPA: FxSxx-COOH system tetratricopeptide repeat protein, partial [Gemmatimonadales bacterium]